MAAGRGSLEYSLLLQNAIQHVYIINYKNIILSHYYSSPGEWWTILENGIDKHS